MPRLRFALFIACTVMLLVGCGGSTLSVPPTDTPVPATNTPAPTATSAPTATPAPTATATAAPTATVAPTATTAPTSTPLPRPSATPTRPAATPTSAAAAKAPFGPAPSGWKTYVGPGRIPVALYYPPDWKLDESAVTTKGQVQFQSPDGIPFLIVSVTTSTTSVSIDTIRDQQAKAIASGCKASGVEATPHETISGVAFDELAQTCDLGQPPLTLFTIAAGLSNGYPWSWVFASTYDGFNKNLCHCSAGALESFLQPMLASFHIYANPAG